MLRSDLSYNALTALPIGAFDGLPSLQYLFDVVLLMRGDALSHNRIFDAFGYGNHNECGD